MAINLYSYAVLTTVLCLVHAQGGYYNPYRIPAGNVYSSNYRSFNNAPLQVFQASRRADTCANHPGSTCMFLLLCLMAGGVSAGPCPGAGFLSTCCVLPATNVPKAARVWPASVSSNVIQTSGTVKPQQVYTTAAVTKTTLSSGNFSYCGITQAKPQSRIIGGSDAMYGEFPWQAHIKLNKQQCGGVLLNNYYVLTAAHCIYQVRLSDITIQLGVYDIQDHSRQDYAPQTFSVVEKKIHPSFKYQAAHPDRYDVALLKLNKAAKFQENVVPICLPPKDWNFQGWKGIITGWGKTDTGLSNRFGTRLLQKVDVPIISNDLCEKWHHEKGIEITISPEMMCAGYEEGKKDACVGDSGGPLMVVVQGRWTVAGLVSAGFGCAQGKQPGIYHRVPHTVEWLRESIKS
jgi:V8-like Glu-specific endopeptidase